MFYQKFSLAILVSIIWIFYRSNQYFEGSIYQTPEVKSQSDSWRFFLPLPKNYEIISQERDSKEEILVLSTNDKKESLNFFYQEILRSKNYQKEYEYEEEGNLEIKYSKDKQEIVIIINEQKDTTSLIFKKTY